MKTGLLFPAAYVLLLISCISFPAEDSSISSSESSTDAISYQFISGIDLPNLEMRDVEQDFLNLEGMIAADLTGDGKDEFIFTPGYIFLDRRIEFPIRIMQADEAGVVSDITRSIIEGSIPTTGWVNTPILVADFNNDGLNDLFFMDHGREDANHNNDFGGHINGLLLSTPAGKLKYCSSTHLPVHNTYNHAGSAGDMDNDGDIDVLVSGFNYVEPRNNPEFNTLYFENDDHGTFVFNHNFVPELELKIFKPPVMSAGTNLITDLNVDGLNDIVFASYVGNDTETEQSIRIYLGNDSGDFVTGPVIPWLESVSPLKYGANQIVSEDFNRDGLPDLLIKLENGGEGIWYLEQGPEFSFLDNTLSAFGTDGPLDLGHIYGMGSPDSFFVRDFNMDSVPDVYVVYSAVDNRHPDDLRDILAENLAKNIWLNDGRGTFRTLESISIINSEYALDKGAFIPGDINGDGKTDFFYLETNYSFDRVRVSALIASD